MDMLAGQIDLRGVSTGTELAVRLRAGVERGKHITFKAYQAATTAGGISMSASDYEHIGQTCEIAIRNAEARKTPGIAAEFQQIRAWCKSVIGLLDFAGASMARGEVLVKDKELKPNLNSRGTADDLALG